jgi:enterobactin synthetase component D
MGKMLKQKVKNWLGKCTFVQELEVQSLMNGTARLIEFSYSLENFDDHMFEKHSISLPLSINQSVLKRRAEFFAGRLAAKIAFCELNRVPLSSLFCLSIGKFREPLWTKGMRGSISHTDRKAMCLLALTKKKAFVGIDVENLMDKSTASEVGMIIQSNSEIEILLAQELPFEVATTLLFSAKESLFKAIFPFVGRYLNFTQSHLVSINSSSRHLTLELCGEVAIQYQIPHSYMVEYNINTSSIKTMIYF